MGTEEAFYRGAGEPDGAGADAYGAEEAGEGLVVERLAVRVPRAVGKGVEGGEEVAGGEAVGGGAGEDGDNRGK